jgi:hypothetical protein
MLMIFVIKMMVVGVAIANPPPYVDTTCQICNIHGHPAHDYWWRYGDDRKNNGDRGNPSRGYLDQGCTTHALGYLDIGTKGYHLV